MLFFLRSWCYFSSSAVALLVGISKFKHIYEAELQLSTRFPFHCQDRFMLSSFLEFFRGRNKCWKSCSKGSPNGPQKSTKIDRKGVQEGSRKGTSKRDPLQDQEKWDFATIYYTLARSEVSKKTVFWGPFWGPFGRQNRWNRGPDE